MKRTHFEKYTNLDTGEIYWRLVTSNGETVADSAEGYKDIRDLRRALRIVMNTNSKTPIVTVHPPGWAGKDRFGNDALGPPIIPVPQS